MVWVGLGDTDFSIEHTYWKSLHENKKCGEGLHTTRKNSLTFFFFFFNAKIKMQRIGNVKFFFPHQIFSCRWSAFVFFSIVLAIFWPINLSAPNS